MSQSPSNRRDFLRSAAALAAAGAVTPYWFSGENAVAAETKSKNDRPHVGLIGVGGQGTYIAEAGRSLRRGGGHLRRRPATRRERPRPFSAARRQSTRITASLLDHKGIDVVTNATPDHWHTAINIAACKAGKDVYAEKPMTLTIDEGKLLCKVVEETGRIVQVGTMQRSFKEFQTAVEVVRNGRIGKLKQVWVALPYYSTKGGPFAEQPVPPQLNWDMYQGQAPLHDYCPERTAFNFRWWYEYAGGIITDWGNHHVDIAHWGMDCELTGPTSVEARGLFPNPHGPPTTTTRPTASSPECCIPTASSCCTSRRSTSECGLAERPSTRVTTPEQIDWLFGKDVPKEIKSYNRNGIMFIGERGKVFVNRGAVHGKAVEELKENPLPANAWRAYPEHGPHGQFLRLRQDPQAAMHAGADRASLGHRLPLDEHFDPTKTKAQMGSGRSADRRRRRGQRLAETQAAAAVSRSRVASRRLGSTLTVRHFCSIQEKAMRYQTCLWAITASLIWCAFGPAQPPADAGRFSGLNMNLGNLSRLSNAETRSISPENFSGEKGKAGMAIEGLGKNAARELGRGWKVSPCVRVKAKSTFTVAEIDGSGAIQQIWLTPSPLDKTRMYDPAVLLGRRDASRRSKCRWATSSPADGASIARSIRCPSASIPAAPSIATGRCRSARRRRSRWKTSTTRTWFSTIRSITR